MPIENSYTSESDIEVVDSSLFRDNVRKFIEDKEKNPPPVATTIAGWENDTRVQEAAETYVTALNREAGFFDSGAWFGGNKAGDITEIMRDEDWRLETIADRSWTSDKFSTAEKEAYEFLRGTFDKTENKFSWDATKDILTDVIASPVSIAATILTGGTGNPAASKTAFEGLRRIAASQSTKDQVIKGVIAGGSGEGAREVWTQGHQLNAGLITEKDNKQVAVAIGIGASGAGILTYAASKGGKAIAKRWKNDLDPETVEARTEAMSPSGQNPKIIEALEDTTVENLSTPRSAVDEIEFKTKTLRGFEERLLADTALKLKRGERKQIEKEIETLQKQIDNDVVEDGFVAEQSGVSKRRRKKAAQQAGRDQLSERNIEAQNRIEALKVQLVADDKGKVAESDLSRLEQLVVPKQFQDEYDEIFARDFIYGRSKERVANQQEVLVDVNEEEVATLAKNLSAKVDGGEKTTEEIQDVVAQTVATHGNKDPTTLKNKLSFEVNRIVNRYGSKILFKPVAVVESFAKYSPTAARLQKMFRYDAGRDNWTKNKTTYDSADFYEVFKQTTGDYLIRTKLAMEPVALNMKGSLADVANRDLIKSLRGSASDSKQINNISKELRSVLDDIGVRLKDGGFIDGDIENYVPRSWNRKAILNNKDVFAQKLVDAGEVENSASGLRLIDDMLDKKNQLDQGGQIGSTFFYKRIFSKIDDNDFEEFLDNDLVSLMQNYITSSSKQIAKKEVFGVKNFGEYKTKYVDAIRSEMRAAGKTLTQTDEANLNNVYKLSTGEGVNRFESQTTQGIVDLYSTANRLAMLPLATISSITEIFINISKAGVVNSVKGLGAALNNSFDTIGLQVQEILGKKGLTQPEIWKEMNQFGLALDNSMADAAERLSGEALNTKTARNINNTFFRVTMLDQWTKFVQMSSYISGKNLITDNLKSIAQHTAADLPDSSRIRKLREELLELNVNIDEGVNWVKGGANIDDNFYNSVQKGAARYTNEVILNPSAESGLKPTLLANPKTAILFQFMGYPAAFSNTILKNASKTLLKDPVGNKANVLVAGLLMTEMARWTNYARSNGKSEQNKTTEEIYAAAVARTGANGLLLDMLQRSNKAAEIWQNPAAGIAGVFGPVGQDLFTFAATGDPVSLIGKKVPGYAAGRTIEGIFGVEFVDDYKKQLKEINKDFREVTVPEKKVSIDFAKGGRVHDPLRGMFNIGGKVGRMLLEDVIGKFSTKNVSPVTINSAANEIKAAVGKKELADPEIQEYINVRTKASLEKKRDLNDEEATRRYPEFVNEDGTIRGGKEFSVARDYTDGEIETYERVKELQSILGREFTDTYDEEIETVLSKSDVLQRVNKESDFEDVKLANRNNPSGLMNTYYDANYNDIQADLLDLQMSQNTDAQRTADIFEDLLEDSPSINPKYPNRQENITTNRKESLDNFLEDSEVMQPVYRATSTGLDTEFEINFAFPREIGPHFGTLDQANDVAEHSLEILDRGQLENIKKSGGSAFSEYRLQGEGAEDYKIASPSITKGYLAIKRPLVINEDYGDWSAEALASNGLIKHMFIKMSEQMIPKGVTNKATRKELAASNLNIINKEYGKEGGVNSILKDFVAFQNKYDLVEAMPIESYSLQVDIRRSHINKMFAKFLQRFKFDGIKYKNTLEGNQEDYSYIPLRPEQFKTFTASQFNSNSPRDTKNKGGKVYNSLKRNCS